MFNFAGPTKIRYGESYKKYLRKCACVIKTNRVLITHFVLQERTSASVSLLRTFMKMIIFLM